MPKGGKMSVNDLLKVSTSEAVNIISESFIKYSNELIINEHPAIFLKGSPGIGKSEAVKQIKTILEVKTNKFVNLVDIRLILFNPVDLRGIPIADKEEKTAIWLKPEIFKLSESSDVINILFLDELTASPKSIQAAAYQIALDKRLGEHKLPKNTFIIAAGNRESDNAVTYEMPSALKNRFIHFEIVNDVNDWLLWAKDNKINEDIIQFINNYPNMLNNESYDGENLIVTPRSWERLSKMLEVLGGSIEDNIMIVRSILGNQMANLLLNKRDKYQFDEIISGQIKDAPKELEDLEQVTALLENNITRYFDDLEKIETVLEFINKLPVDFGIRVFRIISQEVSSEIDLVNNELYKKFINKLVVDDEED